MAKLTILKNDGYQYWPDIVEGGTVSARSETGMTYVSEDGYKIILVGTNFAFDSTGYPSSGDVTEVKILNGSGVLCLKITQVAAALQQLSMFGLGYSEEDGGTRDPDGSRFFEYILRGDDTIIGSDGGDDLLARGSGGFGDDLIIAGNGSSFIKVDFGTDTIRGSADYEELSFEQARDDPLAFRGAVVDAVAGTARDCWGFLDRISKIDGYRDSVFSDSFKGSGLDEIFRLTRGADTVDGGGGFDTVSYDKADRVGAATGIRADLATGRILDPFGATDIVTRVEGLRGTQYADVFKGNGSDNVFQGFRGKDDFDGRAGFDRVEFWKVEELGGVGVTIDTRLSSGQIVNDGFGNHEDAISIESWGLSSRADSFTGNSQDDDVWGDDGNDTLTGGAGEDDLSGGGGNDKLYGGGGPNHISGNEGRDSLYGGSSEDDFNFRELGNTNVDRVYGFSSSQGDEIWLDSDWGGLSSEFLTSAQFRSGAGVTSAVTSSQRVIYDTTTGTLYFDKDGAGGSAAQAFAVIDNKTALTAGDFHVFL